MAIKLYLQQFCFLVKATGEYSERISCQIMWITTFTDDLSEKADSRAQAPVGPNSYATA